MTPVELSRTVLRAVRRAVDEGELSVAVPERAVVTPPGPGGRGDYATNIALQLARPAGRPPRQVAEILRPHISRTEGVADVEITGPGFLNIHLDGAATTALVRSIQGRPHQGVQQQAPHGAPQQAPHGAPQDASPATPPVPYGHTDDLCGEVVELRIPYDIRAEVVADALVRIIASQGGRVEVEHAEPVNLRPVPAPEDPAPLGPDAARWALLYPAAHDRPRVTADLLVQRASNPLFRVRYAHSRVRALQRNAAALGFTSTPGDVRDVRRGVQHDAPHDAPQDSPSATRPETSDATTPLVTALAEYPHALTHAATHRAPDRLARHLVTVADALLVFQHTVLPRGEEKPSAAHRARLALAEAAGTVLAGGLSLLGIDAPEHL
ncbi:ArgS-related anticodon-binding protein NrtL [Streptomyces sp. NPDC046862]|uniref:ArgS-related anticodon-binding protein NrtL n=1 Tax=Streptomyces sp. NPDC046862 TaxID=3154603 RepID=UPI003454D4F9